MKKEEKAFTHRHVTSDDVKSTRSSEFAAEFNVVHILKGKKKKKTINVGQTRFLEYRNRSAAAFTPNAICTARVSSFNVKVPLQLYFFSL